MKGQEMSLTTSHAQLNELREGFKQIREGLLTVAHAAGAMEAEMLNLMDTAPIPDDYMVTQAQNMPQDKEQQPADTHQEPLETQQPAAEQQQPRISLIDVRAKLSELTKAGKKEEAFNILQNAGYQKLSLVPEEKYPEIYQAAEAITAQGAA